jgi:hypothetical protein
MKPRASGQIVFSQASTISRAPHGRYGGNGTTVMVTRATSIHSKGQPIVVNAMADFGDPVLITEN